MVDILTRAHVLLGCAWPRRQPNNTYKVYPSIICNNKLALGNITNTFCRCSSVRYIKIMCSTLAGLEPAISGVGNRRLIH